MLPFPRTATAHTLDGHAAGGGGHRISSSATSPAFLAFVILLAALFLICLCSAAAHRLCSRFSASAASTQPLTLPPRRCRVSLPDMDPAALAGSLPVRAYAGSAGGTGDDVCAVCLGELQAQEQVKAIPACGHVFHQPCIDRWLVLAGAAGRASCPLCRRSAAALKPAAHAS